MGRAKVRNSLTKWHGKKGAFMGRPSLLGLRAAMTALSFWPIRPGFSGRSNALPPLLSRVGGWRASVRVRWQFHRFRSGPQSGSHNRVSRPPLIKPDVRFSRIRLSDEIMPSPTEGSWSSAQGDAGRSDPTAVRRESARTSRSSPCASDTAIVAAASSREHRPRNTPG